MQALDLLSVPAILALVEIVKRLKIPYVSESDYAPAVSLAIGVGLSVLFGGVSVQNLVQGLLLGLSASGLWSGTKSFGQKFGVFKK